MGKAGKVVGKNVSQVRCSENIKLTGGTALSYHTVLWRDDRPEEKKRTKRWLNSCKVTAV